METIEASKEQLQQLTEQLPADTPFVMLNLLRFRQRADYRSTGDEVSGEEAYRRYSRAAAPLLQAVGGEVIWYGDARATVIGPQDECWDQVLMVRYPDLQAFMSLITGSDYAAAVKHRMAALQDSRLIATLPKF
ncbi:DUF1330 domain-containing protein [Pseudomaricurvus sp. HS19]|uniref:DUF1330 domain-containing protein n=1 Tax=Pseudomaricurvus sp. HS19 TaxID=2692626 RepID=UPI001371534B|nr:DUF1330 domain-containing protein [Pseudomaricurvus sp. HS19]MYM63934.1 DUF1330 domain-containing protein [Pseudomaricurvus sp. HS19]